MSRRICLRIIDNHHKMSRPVWCMHRKIISHLYVPLCLGVHMPYADSMQNANSHNDNPPGMPPSIERSTPRPFQQRQPNGLLAIDSRTGGTGGDKTITPSPVSPPPISTDHPPAQFSPDQATPRAQTRQEVESFAERTRLRSSSANSLDSRSSSTLDSTATSSSCVLVPY